MSDNVSIMWGSDTDDIITERFRSFLKNYYEEVQIISGSEFNFESVELMIINFIENVSGEVDHT